LQQQQQSSRLFPNADLHRNGSGLSAVLTGCTACGHDKLVAFSCKRRGFFPSCGARRMSQSAAHLVDNVIPRVPVRQWVLSLPIPLRLLLAARPVLVTPVLVAPVMQVVHRVITRTCLSRPASRPTKPTAARSR